MKFFFEKIKKSKEKISKIKEKKIEENKKRDNHLSLFIIIITKY
jgi:hypothetical protein